VRTNLLVLAVAAALTACGGGGGSGPAATTAPTPAAPAPGTATPPATPVAPASPPSAPPASGAHPLVVMLRGDSTMYGSHPGDTCQGAPNQTCANPAALMQTDVDLLFGAGKVLVVNRAEPGSTLEDDLNGTGSYTDGPLAHELANPLNGLRADVVITNAELNDASYGVAPATYQADLETWAAVVRAAGAVPYYEEPNPTFLAGYPPYAPSGARELDLYYLAAEAAAARVSDVVVLPVYAAFLSAPSWQGLLQADGEHPTDTGYELKEALVMKSLYPLLEQLLQRRSELP
jgi:lysophospholipase L1-like esterase